MCLNKHESSKGNCSSLGLLSFANENMELIKTLSHVVGTLHFGEPSILQLIVRLLTHVSHNQNPVITKMVDTEPYKELRRRPQLFVVGIVPY